MSEILPPGLSFPPLLPTGGTPLSSIAPGFQDIIPPGTMPPMPQAGSSRLASDEHIAELQAWARYDMDRWSLRNERFERDQGMYELAPPQDMPRNARNLVTLNDPRATVDKLARIVARHPNIIEVEPKPGVDPAIAQKMENALYDIDRNINQRWIEALNNPYRLDQALSAVLRGWITSRTMLDPSQAQYLADDPSAIFAHEIIDPAVVYPYKAGGRIRRVTHAYATTVGDMVRDPLLRPFLDPDWFEQDARSNCHITAIYWEAADGGWYHAILGGVGPGSGLSGHSGMWIKQPVELGYNPWDIVLCGGAFYRETPWDDQNFIEQVGTGVLSPIVDNQKQMNKMATRLNELLAQESNPAVSFFSSTGQMYRIDVTAGARNYLMKDDKVELHRVGPDQRDFSPLWEIFSRRQARGALPEALFGDGLSENGLAAAVTLSATRDVLFPYAEGVNNHDALKYRKMLELYKTHGPGQPFLTKVVGATPQMMGQSMMPGMDGMGGMGEIGGMPGMPGMGGGMSMPGMPGMPGMMGMGMNPQMQGMVGMGAMAQPGGGLSPFGQVMAATLDVFDIVQQGTFVTITREDMTPQEIAQRINLAAMMVEKGIISRDTARRDHAKIKNPAMENIKIISETVFQDPRVMQALIPLALSDTGQKLLLQIYMAMQNAVPPQGGGNPAGAGQPGGGGGGGGGGQNQTGNPQQPPGPSNGSLPTQVTPPAAMNPQANVGPGALDPQMMMLQQLLSQMNGGAMGGAGGGGMPPQNFVPQPGRF